jgi:hypothetical protein
MCEMIQCNLDRVYIDYYPATDKLRVKHKFYNKLDLVKYTNLLQKYNIEYIVKGNKVIFTLDKTAECVPILYMNYLPIPKWMKDVADKTSIKFKYVQVSECQRIMEKYGRVYIDYYAKLHETDEEDEDGVAVEVYSPEIMATSINEKYFRYFYEDYYSKPIEVKDEYKYYSELYERV